MFNLIIKFFKPEQPTADQIKLSELLDAERDLVRYEAKLEYDIAMRDMLLLRVQRLRG